MFEVLAVWGLQRRPLLAWNASVDFLIHRNKTNSRLSSHTLGFKLNEITLAMFIHVSHLPYTLSWLQWTSHRRSLTRNAPTDQRRTPWSGRPRPTSLVSWSSHRTVAGCRRMSQDVARKLRCHFNVNFEKARPGFSVRLVRAASHVTASWSRSCGCVKCRCHGRTCPRSLSLGGNAPTKKRCHEQTWNGQENKFTNDMQQTIMYNNIE